MNDYSGITSRGILSIVLGLALVMWPHAALRYIVIFLGILLVVSGAISLLSYFNHKQKAGSAAGKMPIGPILSIIVGTILLIFPAFFVSIIMYVLGAFLVFAGVAQIILLSHTKRQGEALPFSYYIMPIVILIAGIVVLLNPFASATGLLIFFGIMVIIYGIIELFNAYNFKRWAQ